MRGSRGGSDLKKLNFERFYICAFLMGVLCVWDKISVVFGHLLLVSLNEYSVIRREF